MAAGHQLLREALNGFVIRGVSSNIPFQSTLLAHPKFQSGDFNTGFIAEQYSHGFRAEDVPHDDLDLLVALAAAMYRRYRDRAAGISGQMPGHGVQIGEQFVAVIKGPVGLHRHLPLRIEATPSTGQLKVTLGGKPYVLDKHWEFGSIRASGSCNGQPFTAQLERHGSWYRVSHEVLLAAISWPGFVGRPSRSSNYIPA